MHALHKILVNIKSRELCSIDEVRSFAESETEDFYERVFDWRETDTAGRWADEYPVNVILSRDDINRFINELKDVQDAQSNQMSLLLRMLDKETHTTDINKIVFGNYSSMVGYYLKNLGELQGGTYCFESMFYDTDEYTSLLADERVQQIRESQEDRALVMFDYHI